MTRLRDIRLGDLLLAQAVGDVLGDGHVREQGVVLEYGVDVALVRRNTLHELARDADRPSVGLLEAGKHAQGRRLATAGRSEQRQELAGLDGEIDLVDGDDRAEALRHTGQLDRAADGGLDIMLPALLCHARPPTLSIGSLLPRTQVSRTVTSPISRPAIVVMSSSSTQKSAGLPTASVPAASSNAW